MMCLLFQLLVRLLEREVLFQHLVLLLHRSGLIKQLDGDLTFQDTPGIHMTLLN